MQARIALAINLLLCGALLTWSACASADTRIEKRSESPCSPPIVNNAGQVSIKCPGFDKEALLYLENQLSQQFRLLNEKLHSIDDSSRTVRNQNDLIDILRKQAHDWEQRYSELSARLADSPDDSEKATQAHALIRQGEFDKAEAILQELATKQEAQVARAAATQYDLGDLAMLRFAPTAALLHYDKAFRYEPDNPLYADGYATAAYGERNYAEAEKGWTTALQRQRDLAAHDPGAYRPKVATTLNTLGSLYRNTGRLADAEKADTEALLIFRDLAAHDPDAYRPDLAMTLNTLGILYRETGRLADAEKADTEALSIFRDLAAQNSGAYRPDLAMTLNTLGILYRETGRLADAEQADTEAVLIFCDLAAHNPGAYRPDIATALNTLGSLYDATGRLADAEQADTETLSIFRDLAAHSPGAYRPKVATTLNTLGSLYRNTGRLADAEKADTEALSIGRDLAAHDLGAYRPDLAMTLNTLGILYSETGRFADAEKADTEALSIFRDLAAHDPDAYRTKLAEVLGEASWYHLLARQFTEAKATAEEAFALDQSQLWVLTNAAHAEMFLGNTEAALTLHRRYRAESVNSRGQTWRQAILDDFAQFRKAGLEHPLMPTIERLLAEPP
jgi:hypothetical protein